MDSKVFRKKFNSSKQDPAFCELERINVWSSHRQYTYPIVSTLSLKI